MDQRFCLIDSISEKLLKEVEKNTYIDNAPVSYTHLWLSDRVRILLTLT